MSQIASPFRSKSAQESASAPVTEATLLEAAQTDSSGRVDMASAATHCPRFSVRPGEKTVTVYEIGQVGDSLAVRHRGEITKTARECHVSPSRVTVKLGVAGRVLLGPRGRPGTITLPMRVHVADRERNVVSRQGLRVNVTLGAQDPVGYFSTVGDISFEVPAGARPGDYEVFVAFEHDDPGAA